MIVTRLPVSGLSARFHELTGFDDILLRESPNIDTALAIALVSRLAEVVGTDRTDDPLAISWDALPLTDLDALLLGLRAHLFGDRLRADVVCQSGGCGARIDVEFAITDYLRHHAPRKARGVMPADNAGWFLLSDTQVEFRLPNCGDQIASARQPNPYRALIERCIRPADLPAKLLRRVETAMEALAPSLSHDLDGTCPECGTQVPIAFDIRQFVLREMRDHAAFVYEDVHLLAMNYHWSELDILALPHSRRTTYANLARQERKLA